MKSTTRSLILLAAVAAPAVVPADLSAQHRAVPRPAVHGSWIRATLLLRQLLPAVPIHTTGHATTGRRSGISVGFGWYGSVGWYGAFGYPLSLLRVSVRLPLRLPVRLSVSLSRLLLGLWRLGADQIQPRHAEVFIDGYFVGPVDDFDGWAQRLNVAPGEHELTVYLKGYQTYRENVLFRPGATLRVEHVLQPLAPGQPEDARPVPSPDAAAFRSSPRRYPPQDVQRRPGDPVPSPRRGAESGEYGSLSVRVQPLDAEVIVDGEPWQSPEPAASRCSSEGIAPGRGAEGYRHLQRGGAVRRGDSTTLC